jgi:hypothetical protein
MVKGKNVSSRENYMLGMVVLLMCMIGILGSVYGSGLYAWLSLPTLILSIVVRKNKPQWLYVLSLIISILFMLYFFYGFIGSF